MAAMEWKGRQHDGVSLSVMEGMLLFEVTDVVILVAVVPTMAKRTSTALYWAVEMGGHVGYSTCTFCRGDEATWRDQKITTSVNYFWIFFQLQKQEG